MEGCWLYDSCNHIDCESGYCDRKYRLNYLYNMSLLSYAQRKHIVLYPDAGGTDVAEFKRIVEIENNIVDFVNSGKNLFIHSLNCGNGKTTSAVRLAQAYLNKIWPKCALECKVLFIHVPTFLQALKDNISVKSDYVAHIKENINKANLVIWDEISTKAGTEFEVNQLLSMIDQRISLGKSNIYTANAGYKKITELLGERLSSRICQLSIDIELHGGDKRNLIGGNN